MNQDRIKLEKYQNKRVNDSQHAKDYKECQLAKEDVYACDSLLKIKSDTTFSEVYKLSLSPDAWDLIVKTSNEIRDRVSLLCWFYDEDGNDDFDKQAYLDSLNSVDFDNEFIAILPMLYMM